MLSLSYSPYDLTEAGCSCILFKDFMLHLHTHTHTQVQQELVRLDEQELNNKYKIGVLYCKKGQTSEEEMYNNGGWLPHVLRYLDRACVLLASFPGFPLAFVSPAVGRRDKSKGEAWERS